MSLAAPIVFLVALVGAIACCAKALWHAVGMIRGVRGSAAWWVNLVPFVAFALAGALDSSGQAHRAKFVVWGLLAAVFALVAGVVQFLFSP